MLASKLPLRLAAGASRAYTRVHFPRALASSHNVIAISRRSYATPGRPKKAVGETSKAVKRAPKATTTATKTKAATPKKAATKKPAKKPAKKPLKAKKAVKPKVPKTEQQIAARKLRLEKAEIKELKKLALEPPKTASVSSWTVFNREYKQKNPGPAKGSDASVADRKSYFATNTKQAAEAYKSLSPAELERYNHTANQENLEQTQAYSVWVKSHTPQQIFDANRARASLRRRKLTKYTNIEDDRQPKRALTKYILFYQDKLATGDYKNIPVGEVAKLIGAEWNKMSESEKQDYVKRSAENKATYHRQTSQLSGATA